MMCLAASVLTLLLTYLLSAEGALSPPLNLSVDLLDFQGSVHWLPGPGNPVGTRYYVEFTDIKNFSVWKQLANCTNITSTQCCFFLDQLFADYYMRVMAEWKEERSNWTLIPCTFQLYKDTQLSPPNMRISPNQHSIQINLNHWVQTVREVPMRFSVDLFQLMSDQSSLQYIGKNISTGSLRFSNLPPGYYCINASAFHTEMTQHQYLNATECTLLKEQSHRGGTAHIISMVVAVGVLLLLIVPIGIILSTKICFIGTQIGKSYIPKVLHFGKKPVMVLTLDREEPHALPVSVIPACMNEAPHAEVDENATPPYFEKVWFAIDQLIGRESEDAPEDACSLWTVDGLDDVLPYSSAVNMEETEDYSTAEEGFMSGCLGRPHFLSVFVSSLPETIFDEAHENVPHADLDDEENSENPFLCDDSSCCFESTESSDGETDSGDSGRFLESDYEPRPDPRLFQLNAQLRY